MDEPAVPKFRSLRARRRAAAHGRSLILAAFAVGLSVPATAQHGRAPSSPPLSASGQLQVAESQAAEVTLLPGWRNSSGRHVAGLRIRLAPGWKTYWRSPGEVGIPPRFDWSKSENVAATSILWPAPDVIDANGRRSIGYRDEFILPLLVEPEDPTKLLRLQGDLQLGVCGEVCVPVSFSLEATLPESNRYPSPDIIDAMNHTPMDATRAGAEDLHCWTRATDSGVAVHARMRLAPRPESAEVVIFETDDPALWVSGAEVSREGARLEAVSTVLPVDGRRLDRMDPSGLRLTVLGEDRAVDLRCPPLGDD